MFFRNVQPHSGLAYVVVQHLAPDHESLLTEILQRSTSMKVMEAQQNLRLEPDCVYVMPPNREMSVSLGTLQLSPPAQPRGHNMPINTFFSSMAREYDEAATGIILSGTGTDGTLGLKAILEAGGGDASAGAHLGQVRWHAHQCNPARGCNVRVTG